MSSIFSSKYLSFYASGLVIILLVLAYFGIGEFRNFIDDTWRVLKNGNDELTREYFKQFGIWGPLAIIIFIILQMFLIIFPSWLPIIIAVMAYGFWLGVLISLIGVTLASTIGYYIGVKLKGAFLEKVIGKKNLEKMHFWIYNYAFGSVVLFRISPFLSNDAISFLAGMFEMKYKRFITATLAGMVPLTLAVGYFSEDTQKLKDGLYWIGGAGLVAYAIYIYIDQKKRKRK
ncbi:TVP38/TMEM64 family protein [Antarcticibacterium flavum]|uniref:TVP38/TMEM64 family membrane protein n=1 Tax=Antarcticibacterium flavum TaxID=2058175 RepID=A0A5B7X5T3_9FLAO|nr:MULTISPECIES: VTT domain-containing protein [Antarcticibacterium]MCM4159791.1 TVP38/TMEM64 family protein [Antarcticibacterium sp. W02-3]QCY70719.1 TVP38/TMEM64 family protein [Antarcticibacterium flavum]